MKAEVEYKLRLGANVRYRHKHIKKSERIVYFRVQLEILLNDKWFPVVRYDTSHGFAHRDLINRKGEEIKTPVFIQDYNDALTFAESDLKANWDIYEERFLKE